MGNISSRPDDGSPLFCRDQTRFAITSIKITNGQNKSLYSILPNTFPATRYIVEREPGDETVIEYVQDPDPALNSPNFLLRLNSDDEIFFYFTIALRRPDGQSQTEADTAGSATATSNTSALDDTNINGLTYVSASTPRELETLLTREFNADPNLHRHPNVDLVGDYSTAGKSQEHFEWAWKWRPPKGRDEQYGGWRSACSFVEYDQRAHGFNTLVSFSFWVHGTARKTLGTPNALLPVPTLDALRPARNRIPSTQSLDSRLSDSDTEATKDSGPPLSPIATIPESGPALEPVATPNLVKVDLNYQQLEEDMTTNEDGPVFRATMKALESKTGSMRQRMKHVLKKAEAAKASQVVCNQAIAAFMDSLQSAAASNANAVKPALDHYFEKIAKEILRYEEMNAHNLQKLIIDPISKLYSNDLKQADAKKKDFEDESKDYYAYMSRYLGQRQDSMKDKKRAESDSKYQSKRKTFELKRFDYSSFMQDLHGGRKDQEVLSQLTKFADAQAKGYLETAKKIEMLLPQLEALNREVKEADKQYQLLRTGREEKRRALEKDGKTWKEPDSRAIAMNQPAIAEPTSDPFYNAGAKPEPSQTEPNSIPRRPVSSTGGDTLNAAPVSVLGSSPGSIKSNTLRDMDIGDTNGARPEVHRKEGLLWSMSRPGIHVDPMGLNKQSWHKFWVVLDQGKLSEYVNWKSQMERHMEPIDLRVASVREARNSERRFCFEVITPHYTRIYQATGEDDMKSWILTINNALQSAFEGRVSSPQAEASRKGSGSIGKEVFGKSSSFHGHRSSSTSHAAHRSVGRYISVGERPTPTRRRSEEERASQLLQKVRAADAGNVWCADCGADSKVEWVSINLGVILCIECSGIHRSLGTHISKIRSLTLDVTSFTQDLVEVLLALGNRVSNMIWEGVMDPTQKPTPNSPREQRLAFITAKYVHHAFVEPLSAATSSFHSPDETLLASIKKNDIQGVLYALALGANPRATDRVRSAHAIFLALAACDPAAPGTPTSTSSSATSSVTASTSRKAFSIAELLLQNGADLPSQHPPFPLSTSAQGFLEFKKAQRMGRTTSGAAASSQPPSSYPNAAASPPLQGSPISPTEKDRQRLVKRSSAGGALSAVKFNRAPGGDS